MEDGKQDEEQRKGLERPCKNVFKPYLSEYRSAGFYLGYLLRLHYCQTVVFFFLTPAGVRGSTGTL